MRMVCDAKVLEEKTSLGQDFSEIVEELPFKAPGSCYFGAFVETELKDKKGRLAGMTQHEIDVPRISEPAKQGINYIKE